MTRTWLQFPEALYMVSLSNREQPSKLAQLAIDAVSFTDVETFLFSHLGSSDWEVTDIEKTYAYGKMYGGEQGERIDFQLGADLKSIITFHIDELDVAVPDDEGVKSVAGASWQSIIESAARRQVAKNDFSKKVSS